MVRLPTLPLDAEYDFSTNALAAQGKTAGFQARTVGEMAEVLADKSFVTKTNYSTPCYFMFRDVHRKEDEAALARTGLRYDVTSLLPTPLGKEFNKTYGHYHPVAQGSFHAYPELYEVLHGTAWYALHKKKAGADGNVGKNNEIDEVIVVEAKAGEKVLVQPDYGHITINPSTAETLVMANLVDESFKSDYSAFKQKSGGAYYAFTDGTWKPNPSFAKPPKLQKTTARRFGGNKRLHEFKENTYAEFVKNPEAFSFLGKPDELF
jgi:glucose-6-phosphate isomerase